MGAFNVFGSYSYQTNSMDQAGLQNAACVIGTAYNFLSDGSVQTTALSAAQIAAGLSILASRTVLASNYLTLCGNVADFNPVYPTSRTWTVSHREKSEDISVGGDYAFSKVRLYANYNYSKSTTEINYTYNAAALGLTPAQVALIGSGFPNMKYDRRMLELTAVVPMSKKSTVRLLYRYETGKIRDWHYDGVMQNPAPNTNQQTFLDSGPQDYNVSVAGVFFGVNF
jgi:predicted porin